MFHLNMVKVAVIVQFLLLVIITKNANGENSLGIISKYFSRDRNPLIIVLNSASEPKNLLRSTSDNNKDYQLSAGYLNDILRSTGDPNDPIVKETNEKFERALRSRCEKYLQCEVKCKKPKKKKKDCLDSCKKLDKLNLCNTTKEIVTEKVINISTKGPPVDDCESRDSCNNSCENNECKESGDSCETDDCKESGNSCETDDCKESGDSCETDDCEKSKDSCEESDGCKR